LNRWLGKFERMQSQKEVEFTEKVTRPLKTARTINTSIYSYNFKQTIDI